MRVRQKKRALWGALLLFLAGVLLFALSLTALAAPGDIIGDPVAETDQPATVEDLTESPLNGLLGDRTSAVDIVILLTILMLLPSILLMMTGFTRIIIVLSFVRNAMGTQNMPPNQVMIGLALFLTFFVMAPVISQVNEQAYQPYVNEEITQQEMFERAEVPIRTFMLKQTFPTDMQLFIDLSGRDDLPDLTTIQTPEEADLPMEIVIPAYITSEIKRAFQIGFFIYIPFVVIDMVVASTLMSMGMMMLPPSLISMPFKIMLFVVVDGWTLTVKTLVTSFTGGGG